MDLHNRIWNIVSHANTSHQLMFDSWKVDVMKEMYKKINEDNILAIENADDDTLWNFFRPTALKWMQENWPESWFLPMYMTIEEQQESGNYLMMD